MTAPPLTWGTTRVNTRNYHGRVHIVRPDREFTAWCRLPVDYTFPLRPPPPPGTPVICPECSINYLAATYPEIPTSRPEDPTEPLSPQYAE